MRNNVEFRQNGTVKIERKSSNGYTTYHVSRRSPHKVGTPPHTDWKPSKHSPWDYLANARKDADDRLTILT